MKRSNYSACDLLNTTIVLPQPGEELALPLNGNKNDLTRKDLVDYYGRSHLQLTSRIIDKILMELEQVRTAWEELLIVSFLSAGMKEKYFQILHDRFKRFF